MSWFDKVNSNLSVKALMNENATSEQSGVNTQPANSIFNFDVEGINGDNFEASSTDHVPQFDIEINTTINGHKVKFSFNQAKIEDYIINKAKDSHGNRITLFKDINDIREKKPENRTQKEKDLLKEFENMIKWITHAGIDYGINPNFIVAIIQREVGFDGYGKQKGRAIDVTSSNGKGYMQITSAPVKDIFGWDGRKYNQSKVSDKLYGPEVVKLMASRGFDVNCPENKKPAMVQKVLDYLKQNKDPEFNIRLGTLILRYYYYRANENIEIAAKNYNGSPQKVAYGRAVNQNFRNAVNNNIA